MDARNPEHLVKHYGSVPAVAAAGGVSTRAVYKWLSAGQVPSVRAYQYEVLTDGKLKVNGHLKAG